MLRLVSIIRNMNIIFTREPLLISKMHYYRLSQYVEHIYWAKDYDAYDNIILSS